MARPRRASSKTCPATPGLRSVVHTETSCREILGSAYPDEACLRPRIEGKGDKVGDEVAIMASALTRVGARSSAPGRLSFKGSDRRGRGAQDRTKATHALAWRCRRTRFCHNLDARRGFRCGAARAAPAPSPEKMTDEPATTCVVSVLERPHRRMVPTIRRGTGEGCRR